MTKIFSIHSFRGGTGKSNITANTAVSLAKQGYRVGVIDSDIQSPGIHVIFNQPGTIITNTLNNYLWGDCKIEDASYKVYTAPGDNDGGVWLVPSSINAHDIARILREKYDAEDMHSAFRNFIISRSLDFLLIDTHPGLHEETLLSIVISDALIIILRPDQQDFQGTSVTVDVARRLKVPNIRLIVNKIPEAYSLEEVRNRVEQTYDCEVAVLISLSTDIAQNASSEVFCLQHPDHSFSVAINGVVTNLLALAEAQQEEAVPFD
ncbi:MAG: MinD/ParA family protein [Chloroflexi bacterium]|nr:MinD/ParA family protein [Chloroflexota bacterium]